MDGIDKTIIKLQVLENRIQQLKAIADEVLGEVNNKYMTEINELYLKKDEAKQKLKIIREAHNSDQKTE